MVLQYCPMFVYRMLGNYIHIFLNVFIGDNKFKQIHDCENSVMW